MTDHSNGEVNNSEKVSKGKGMTIKDISSLILPNGSFVDGYEIVEHLDSGVSSTAYMACYNDDTYYIEEYLPINYGIYRAINGAIRIAQLDSFRNYEIGKIKAYGAFKSSGYQDVFPDSDASSCKIIELNNTVYFIAKLSNGQLLSDAIGNHHSFSNEVVTALVHNGIQKIESLQESGRAHQNINANTIYISKGELKFLCPQFSLANEAHDGGMIIKNVVSYYWPALVENTGPLTSDDIRSVHNYQFAATLYYLLTERPPVDLYTRHRLKNQYGNDPVVPLSVIFQNTYDRQLLVTLDKMMSIKPEERLGIGLDGDFNEHDSAFFETEEALETVVDIESGLNEFDNYSDDSVADDASLGNEDSVDIIVDQPIVDSPDEIVDAPFVEEEPASSVPVNETPQEEVFQDEASENQTVTESIDVDAGSTDRINDASPSLPSNDEVKKEGGTSPENETNIKHFVDNPNDSAAEETAIKTLREKISNSAKYKNTPNDNKDAVTESPTVFANKFKTSADLQATAKPQSQSKIEKVAEALKSSISKESALGSSVNESLTANNANAKGKSTINYLHDDEIKDNADATIITNVENNGDVNVDKGDNETNTFDDESPSNKSFFSRLLKLLLILLLPIIFAIAYFISSEKDFNFNDLLNKFTSSLTQENEDHDSEVNIVTLPKSNEAISENSTKQEDMIKSTLEQAALKFKEEKYFKPLGLSAYSDYSYVLEIDPDNEVAQAGIENLEKFYYQKVRDSIENKEIDLAKLQLFDYFKVANEETQDAANLSILLRNLRISDDPYYYFDTGQYHDYANLSFEQKAQLKPKLENNISVLNDLLVNKGDLRAQFIIAYLAIEGIIIEKNMTLALNLLNKIKLDLINFSNDDAMPWAARNLAIMNLNGWLEAEDINESNRLFTFASMRGDALSMYYLSQSLREKSPTQADQFLSQAVQNGLEISL